MIRLLSFLILFGATAIVTANPLYKWVESDGSITFSVTPPPAGINYETINDPGAAQAITRQKPAEQSDNTPALNKALPTNSETSSPTQRLAPQQGQQNPSAIRPGLTPGYPEKSTGNVMGAAVENPAEQNRNASGRSAAQSAKSRKQRQCEDLKKRVISLEGRLRTRLTPDDMDNTVIHMARYQRSYDQHCMQ